jgi:hypothetical protein
MRHPSGLHERDRQRIPADDIGQAMCFDEICQFASRFGRAAHRHDCSTELASHREAGNDVTERYVASLLDPHALAGDAEASGLEGHARLVRARASEVTADERARIRQARATLIEEGRPVETFRRIELDDALSML